MDPHSTQRLYRSNTDRIIAGVCGGLAEYLHVDSTIVRLIFIVLAFMGGAGIVLYLILMIIVPASDTHADVDTKEKMREFVEKAAGTVQGAAEEFKNRVNAYDWPQVYMRRRRRRALLIGGLCVIAGLLLLVQQLFPMYWIWVRGEIVWPLLLIILGLYLILRPRY